MASPAVELAIRAMRAADLPAVARIERARLAAAGLARPPRRSPRELLAAAVALVGVDPRGRVAGYLVGDVRAWEQGSGPAGWIFALGVDRRFERHGLGRRLVEAAARRFAACGATTVRAMVRRDDVPVLRFFRGQGFTGGPYLELELDLGAG
jgi:ribosomal protein S18 acetylase RimI-like enzyme